MQASWLAGSRSKTWFRAIWHGLHWPQTESPLGILNYIFV